MTNDTLSGASPTLDLVETLIEATLLQEAAAMTALQAGLQAAVHPTPHRTDAEIEADLDNMPI